MSAGTTETAPERRRRKKPFLLFPVHGLLYHWEAHADCVPEYTVNERKDDVRGTGGGPLKVSAWS